ERTCRGAAAEHIAPLPPPLLRDRLYGRVEEYPKLDRNLDARSANLHFGHYCALGNVVLSLSGYFIPIRIVGGDARMDKPSLRAIKREATAQAIAEAAFALARERGLDGFVVDDIVQLAGFSRRTFANYYACKEEAVAMAVMTHHDVDE